jgi:Type ISP C-terminal specificity domain
MERNAKGSSWPSPLTTDVQRFRALSQLGGELVALHLMEKTASPITPYPMAGDNKVDQVRYTEPGIDDTEGRVWINRIQHFEGAPPEVWSYHIGGYPVAQKWLKDCKSRQLTFDDLTHCQRIISALVETFRIQNEIDRVIEEWPMRYPINGGSGGVRPANQKRGSLAVLVPLLRCLAGHGLVAVMILSSTWLEGGILV